MASPLESQTMIDIVKAFRSCKEWILSFFHDHVDLIRNVFKDVTTVANSCRPIVKAIDEELKPAIANNTCPMVQTLTDFLLQFVEVEVASSEAQRLASLPMDALLSGVAYVIARTLRATNGFDQPTVEAGILVAYRIYKVIKQRNEM